MFNNIYKILIRFIGSIMLIYGIDVLLANLDIIIPINYFSVLLLTILGLPGLFAFIVIFILI